MPFTRQRTTSIGRRAAAALSTLALTASALILVSPSAHATPADYETVDVVVSDSFSRTLSSGWGTSSSGTTYSSNPTSSLSVRDGRGVASLASGSNVNSTLSSVKVTDALASVQVRANQMPSGGNGAFTTLTLRGSSSASYQATLRFDPNGILVVKIVRAGSSSAVLLPDKKIVSNVRSGVDYQFDFQVAGSSTVELAVRAYPVGSSAPAWQSTVTDSSSSRITAAGYPGVGSYVSSASSAVTQSYDNYSVATVSVPDDGGDDDPAPGPDPDPDPTPSGPVGSLSVGSASYAVPSNAVYVAGNENSTGNGSQSSPYGSLATAVTKAASGSTLVLRAGTYHESVEIPFGKKLTIQNYPKEAVWFDGASAVTSWIKSGSTYYAAWNHNLNHQVSFSKGLDQTSWWVNSNYPMAGWPEQVWINGVEMTQVSALSKVTSNTFFVDNSAKRLYIGTDPSGKKVEATTLQKALQVHGVGTTLRGFGVRRYATTMYQMGAVSSEVANVTLENLLIKQNSTVGLFSWGESVTMNRVTASNNGSIGIGMNNSGGAKVTNSDVSFNNQAQFNAAPVSGGLKAAKMNNSTFSNNLFEGNVGSHGLWFDAASKGITISGNTFVDNGGDGLEVELTDTVKVVNNYAIGNGAAGIRIFNTSHVEIWNNTLADNAKYSFRFLQDERRSGNSSVPYVNNAINVRNNVVAFGTGGCPILVDDISNQLSASQMNISMKGNAYHRKNSSTPSNFACWETGSSIASYSTLDSFRSGTGQGAQSKLFEGTSILNNSYHLTSTASSSVASTALSVSDQTLASLLGVSTGWKGLGATGSVITR